MPPVTCRRCKGSRGNRNRAGKWFDCKACNGSGINHDLWETHCRECYTSIVYKKGQNEPQYCKNCRNREKTKTCAQYGCTNTIRYKLGWTNVSDYCGPCRKHRERGDTAKSCTSCGKLIWMPWNKNFTMCRDCNERERAKKAAQWKTKSCSKCGAEVKYHVDWSRVPDLCKSCKEKEKAKWQTKPCKGCGASIKYNTDWDHPPNFCKDCKDKQKNRPDTRLYVESDGTNYRVKNSRGEKLATMGKFTPSSKHGPNAEKQNEYARSGYWWLALEGKPHLTYVFRDKPVQNGRLTSLTKSVEIKGPQWFYDLVVNTAIATLSLD